MLSIADIYDEKCREATIKVKLYIMDTRKGIVRNVPLDIYVA